MIPPDTADFMLEMPVRNSIQSILAEMLLSLVLNFLAILGMIN